MAMSSACKEVHKKNSKKKIKKKESTKGGGREDGIRNGIGMAKKSRTGYIE
jgi:hypothetical protein